MRPLTCTSFLVSQERTKASSLAFSKGVDGTAATLTAGQLDATKLLLVLHNVLLQCHGQTLGMLG